MVNKEDLLTTVSSVFKDRSLSHKFYVLPPSFVLPPFYLPAHAVFNIFFSSLNHLNSDQIFMNILG